MPVITLCSFKGGTAKTSISLHIAAALTKFHNKKTLVIDFDAQSNLTSGLGFDPDEQDSLASVFQGKKQIQEIILKTAFKKMDIIPADTWLERIELTGELASNRYSHEKLKEILKYLKYDYIIIDTPPSLCWLTESALIAADYSLICATPEFYSVKGLQRLALFLNNISQRHPLKILGVVLSFWNKRGKNNKIFQEVIESIFPRKLLTSKIRRDIAISEASILGQCVFETHSHSRASQDFKDLTQEIIDIM